MLRVMILAGAVLLSPVLMAEGQPRYISDDIYVYIHGGPGNQYRIIGSIKAGEKVNLLPEQEDEFSHVIDDKGRDGWIRTDSITDKVSLRYRMPELEGQLTALQSRLQAVNGQSDATTDQLESLQNQLKETQDALQKMTAERDQALAQVANVQDDARFKMWQEGGMIAAAGLVLGVILVYLPRPQRRRRDRWM